MIPWLLARRLHHFAGFGINSEWCAGIRVVALDGMKARITWRLLAVAVQFLHGLEVLVIGVVAHVAVTVLSLSPYLSARAVRADSRLSVLYVPPPQSVNSK